MILNKKWISYDSAHKTGQDRGRFIRLMKPPVGFKNYIRAKKAENCSPKTFQLGSIFHLPQSVFRVGSFAKPERADISNRNPFPGMTKKPTMRLSDIIRRMNRPLSYFKR